MRLKKIKLAGFKSFVDPTSIPFPDDMTAIVGPNGCGKSNVIDAVRWVLGESSAKNLRGDAMTDVIFNGSSARKPVSQCSVELVFDNSSGRIQGEYANYNELSVKRLVTRDGQSNYFLNSSKCRKRDVTDLFLGTGLGPRSYAIIEQGMISRLIESKPQDLRIFIEEAAGISKYKERRRETENRIRHTKENLERLDDVRGELGQQLEKLQRQAAAATRYKELKQKERTLKAELAALRWLKHSEHIARLDADISKQQSDIDGFIAQQRGDEKGIALYREQQQDLKQQLSDIQQQYFLLGTDITRLEQSQLHAKQRRQQIDQELQSLAQSLDEAVLFEQEQRAKIESLGETLQLAEPEQDMLAEQIEQAQEQLLNAQDTSNAHESQWREHEQTFSQTKQQVQTCHSQIQATMNLQLRTQQRINELHAEQNELQHDELAAQIDDLKQQLTEAAQDEQQAKIKADSCALESFQGSESLQDIQQQLLQAQGQLQQVQAKIAALESIQDSVSGFDELNEFLLSQELKAVPLYQSLEIEPGWEAAVAAACKHWQDTPVVTEVPALDGLMALSSGQLLIARDNPEQPSPNSLASKISSKAYPQWFMHVQVVESAQQAIAMLGSLNKGESVVTRDGQWFGPNWITFGSQEQRDSLLQRAAQIKLMSQSQLEYEDRVAMLQREVKQTKENVNQVLENEQVAAQALRQAEQRLSQSQNQLNLLQMQQQQSLSRRSRLNEELAKQKQMLEDETLQSEELAMQVEELEMHLAQLQDQQQDMQTRKSQLQHHVDGCRAQVEQLTQRSHQLALTIQATKSQYQGLIDNQQRNVNQKQGIENRINELRNEAKELGQPLDEQQARLTELLEQRVETEIQQSTIANQLSEVEELLSIAEKGQQGIVEKIQQMRSALESTKLECEGYKVRANATLEQLQELNQPLKPVLESLPDEAEENSWLQDLEKTQAAVGRLGAVNLAAVEEFEIQAQRKKHLDDQNEDLVAAMETLESAIRKIDKETRTRFKETFERVNTDLKELFPKVFGGGSAYLELTDDDLLETGVAIMARPPGKKNSTIHLLSGGEKALTALSLVFAIFRLNPAPFCLLDEVDAPLDDANVGRFCKLVSEMSKTVQFIYITHNKIAMEMAKHLTGVTMSEPGVSRMVAVDVEEAVAIALA